MEISKENSKWAAGVQSKLKAKMAEVTKRNMHKIPYTATDGVFDDKSGKDICWWTNGFWGGMMWQMFHLSRDEMYKKAAEELEEKQDANLMKADGLDHDNGFKWLPTAVINYRLTGREASYNRAMLAATNLAGRYNPSGRFIRAWNNRNRDDVDNRGWAIIDCMMNLPLLYWAHEETSDPRFYEIAVNHANTVIESFIRDDGSVNHIVEFDTITGEKKRTRTGQGKFNGSSWTRGQAWGIYGFTLSYLHTKNDKFIEAARKIGDYYIDNIPANGHIPADFYQTEDVDYEDGTAAAIAACGFIEMAKALPEELGAKYMDAAMRLLTVLDKEGCDWDPAHDPLILKCTGAYHDKEHNFPIIYGDYFFMEAVAKLAGNDLMLW